MGKKTREKGAKKEKEEKIKTVKSGSAALKEALEATGLDNVTPTPFRPAVGKKSERSVNVKIGCVESFRWEAKETPSKLPPLPPQDILLTRFSRLRSPAPNKKITNVHWGHYLTKGWSEFLKQRFGEERALLEVALKSTALKDGLSGPLTIVYLIYQHIARLTNNNNALVVDSLNSHEPLHIVLVGASAVNEEKILKETNYWEEIGILLAGRQVRLYLTGLEMSGNYSVRKTDDRQDLDMPVECWKGDAADFLLQSGRLETFQTEETYIVGLNPGFGPASVQVGKILNKDVPAADVIWGWLPSLYLMAALDIPMLFTESSQQGFDHMSAVLQCVIGTYSFGCAMISKLPFDSCVYVAEGQEPVRANQFIIIVQGQQPGMTPLSSTPVTPDTRPDALRKVLRATAGTLSTIPVYHAVPDSPSYSTNRKEMLEPLKRYGNYPPEAAAEAAAEAEHIAYLRRQQLATPDDVESTSLRAQGPGVEEGEDGGGEGTGGEREMSAKEILGQKENFEWVDLECSIAIKVPENNERELVVTLKEVFVADPRTARVGVRKECFALFYTDCPTFRQVKFEAWFPDGVDHTTARVVFRPSEAQVKITVLLLKD